MTYQRYRLDLSVEIQVWSWNRVLWTFLISINQCLNYIQWCGQ